MNNKTAVNLIAIQLIRKRLIAPTVHSKKEYVEGKT
jgi:hypothetical protein